MRRQGAGSAAVPAIVDTDPGIDDAVALALAARAPEIALGAVTTTYGNAPLPVTTRNARYVLALAGRRDIPVLPGSAAPLSRTFDGSPVRHGPQGLGCAVPPPPVVPEERADTEALLRGLDVLPPDRRVVLITLGPLTNLAHALRADPARVHARIAAHVAVMGAFTPTGDAAAPDFNVAADPEAVDLVLASGLPTCIVPLDVSSQVRVPEREIQRARDAPDPLVRMLGDALAYPGGADRAVHDAVAVAGVLTPDVLDFSPRRLKIGKPAGPAPGALTVDPGGYRVELATAVRVPAVRRLLGRVLAPPE